MEEKKCARSTLLYSRVAMLWVHWGEERLRCQVHLQHLQVDGRHVKLVDVQMRHCLRLNCQLLVSSGSSPHPPCGCQEINGRSFLIYLHHISLPLLISYPTLSHHGLWFVRTHKIAWSVVFTR